MKKSFEYLLAEPINSTIIQGTLVRLVSFRVVDSNIEEVVYRNHSNYKTRIQEVLARIPENVDQETLLEIQVYSEVGISLEQAVVPVRELWHFWDEVVKQSPV